MGPHKYGLGAAKFIKSIHFIYVLQKQTQFSQIERFNHNPVSQLVKELHFYNKYTLQFHKRAIKRL